MKAPTPCHDCAFRKDSPEQGREMVQIMEALEGAMKGGKPFAPFYCHQGMPIDDKGEYCPPLDARGAPIGFPLCAGWIQALDRLQRKMDAENTGLIDLRNVGSP
jgi:hypothetical protein